jgi:hypothetical protein
MSFKVVSGVCRPQTHEALKIYKGIQQQVNRILDASGKDLLFVDGRIGTKTIAAVNFALGTNHSNCAGIAENAGPILNQLANTANNKQLPVVADPKSVARDTFNPPSKFDAETGTVVHPSLATAGFAGVPLWLIALAAGGGYYYFYMQNGKKKRKPKKRKSLAGRF